MKQWALMCGALLGCVLAGAMAAAQAETVRLSYAEPTADYAGFFVAIEKGFYRDSGITVELVRAGGGVATPALIAGDIQFSSSASSAISAILRGAKLKIVAITEDRPDFQLWASAPSIKSLEDLRGKPVGVITRGDTGEIAVRYLLMKRHLPADFLGFTPFGPGQGRMAALAAHDLPAAVLFSLEADSVRRDKKFAGVHLLADLRNDTRMAFNGLATTDKLIATQPALIRRFLLATLQGIAYAKAHRDATAAVVARYASATLEAAAADYDHIVPAIVSDGVLPHEIQLNELRLRAAMLGPDAKTLAPAEVFDFSAVRGARAELLDHGWKP